MNRLRFQPRKELKHVIKNIEILDLSDTTALGIGNRFLPDGFFEIGFNLGSRDLKITSAAVSYNQLDNPVGYFYGQGSVSTLISSTGRLYIMIVKLYPWAASLFFDFDLSSCLNISLSLDQIFGKEIKFLEEKILEAEGHTTQIGLLEEYLITKLNQKNNTINLLLEKSTGLLIQSNGNIRMKELATQVHSSLRTLQRLFRQYYGITPKQYSQQLRLRYFASQLSQHKSMSLTEIALHCGYFDQAHFNHEFKTITQVTPSEFFFDKIPLVDYFL